MNITKKGVYTSISGGIIGISAGLSFSFIDPIPALLIGIAVALICGYVLRLLLPTGS